MNDALTDGTWRNENGVLRWEPSIPAWRPGPPNYFDLPPGRQRRSAAKCGTDTGYYRHIRTLRQPACDECKRAHAAYERARYERAQEAS